MWPFRHVHEWREREISGVFSSSDKDTSPIGLGPHPYNLTCNLAYNLNYLL